MPTLGHSLGQASVDAQSYAERAAILAVLGSLLGWYRLLRCRQPQAAGALRVPAIMSC